MNDDNERFSFHGINGAMIVHSRALLVTPTPDFEMVCVAPAQALKCFVKNARTMPYGLLSQIYEALATQSTPLR